MESRTSVGLQPLTPLESSKSIRSSNGNNRTALVILELFLIINGYRLAMEESEILDAILGLAEGKITEKSLTNWVRARLTRRQHAE